MSLFLLHEHSTICQSLLKGQSRRLRIHFDYGGGLVNPNKAANPSLIYDISTNDYISYLCAFGYNTSAVFLLVQQATSCPVTKPSILDVNLPSITIPNLRNPVTLTRTVMNTGSVNSMYKAQIEPPSRIKVVVKLETPSTRQLRRSSLQLRFPLPTK
ncbi:subtilisin-like protease SBT5.3 [Pyrus ussuriensis x Pyrus communis]|uniref:Subtilisin-like protease SBT5.3 n=1 Tax=Pyrus ussuriensis x Pyrus communis TaxID=2448454 RepID=A0A5N5HYJ3_9ROSA|nr:subtilisin-like protease SBT5.3 [Pyrus ussuriensis x Pyrus communis]